MPTGWTTRRDARKCGEAGIPTAGDMPPTPTGRQSEIARAADSWIATLRRQAQRQTAADGGAARQAERADPPVQAKVDELGAKEAAILGRAVYRLPAETDVPDEVVADRRAADNRKEAAPIRQQIDRAGPSA